MNKPVSFNRMRQAQELLSDDCLSFFFATTSLVGLWADAESPEAFRDNILERERAFAYREVTHGGMREDQVGNHLEKVRARVGDMVYYLSK